MNKFRKSHWLLVVIQHKWWEQNWADPPGRGLPAAKSWVSSVNITLGMESSSAGWRLFRECLLYNHRMNFIVHKPLLVILFTSLGSIPRNRIIGSKNIYRYLWCSGSVDQFVFPSAMPTMPSSLHPFNHWTLFLILAN